MIVTIREYTSSQKPLLIWRGSEGLGCLGKRNGTLENPSFLESESDERQKICLPGHLIAHKIIELALRLKAVYMESNPFRPAFAIWFEMYCFCDNRHGLAFLADV